MADSRPSVMTTIYMCGHDKRTKIFPRAIVKLAAPDWEIVVSLLYPFFFTEKVIALSERNRPRRGVVLIILLLLRLEL